MIPVEVTQTPWHYTTWLDLFDHWQTGLAGAAAVLAATATVWAMWSQTETTVRLEQERFASETTAFRAMLEAAMTRVLAEAAEARKTYASTFETGAPVSVEALAVRQSITKGAFAELRAACVRQGSPLTGEFLDLEREIDSFALQWQDAPSPTGLSITFRMGKCAGLGDQLAVIEAKATKLRQKAAERIRGDCRTLPLGSVGYEAEANERGECLIWLEGGDGGSARRDAATGAVASKGEARKP
jgi:hypothetical protein